MRYSNEFKKKSVGLYRQGRYPKTPDNISSERFHKQVREWVRRYKLDGYIGLCGKPGRRPKEHQMAKRPKEKYHSYKGNVGRIAENLIDRDFSTTKPFEKWNYSVYV